MSGIAQLPGFEASLRLLVERERYSQTDIAMMFGVTRERMRQICDRLGLSHPDGSHRVGLNCIRVWNDSDNRFHPLGRGTLNERKRKENSARRRSREDVRRAERRARMTDTLLALRNALGRDPTWREMYLALGGDPSMRINSSAPIVLGRWGLISRSLPLTLTHFRETTGIEARALGEHGHIAKDRRTTCRKFGHPLREYPSGLRACPTCELARKRAYAARQKENRA